jgi:hypothetical protein
MRCDEVAELLVPLEDGEVTPSQRMLLRGHLHRCNACLGRQRALQRATPQPFLEPPPEILRALEERVNVDIVWERSLVDEPIAVSPWWTRWLREPATLSRGGIVAWAAVVLASLGWGLSTWWAPSAAPALPGNPPAISADHYQPASYVPEEDAAYP